MNYIIKNIYEYFKFYIRLKNSLKFYIKINFNMQI